jgi:hypothetical protein
LILAGIDEAGYGPTLGPLVVSLAAFRTEDRGAPDLHDLWTRLGEATVLRAPPAPKKGERARRAAADPRLVVCDSKKLYQGGKGLRRMEETVLAFLSLSREDPCPAGGTTLRALLPLFGLDEAALAAYPWYAGRCDRPVPTFTFRTWLEKIRGRLERALAAAGVEPLHLRPRAVHPREFNGGVRAAGNKHLFEWGIVAEHLRFLWDRYAAEGIHVVCDRLSGRDFYGPPLADLFPEARVTAPLETEERSTYRVTRGARRMEVTFLVEGDDKAFPVALASCAAKYVRELFMRPLNDFFAEQVPGLRATAGYHGDARRFLEEIGPAWRKLALDDAILVRSC